MNDVAALSVDRIDVQPVNKRGRRSLLGKFAKIYPKRVLGRFRTLKWWIMGVTLGIYYLTPWLRWDRGAHAPDQAVLVDIPSRRFYFFFIEIWPQEVYYLTGLLIMAALGLFFATSLAGRVWCGYTCPQTVWTDLFIAVERFIEGDRNARIRLDRTRWSFDKLGKRLAKYAVWLVVAACTGGAWVFYFADAPTLAADLVRFEAPPIAYVTIAVLTGFTFLFGGFMREKVCTYLCPWPRIMGGLLDEESLVVTYREHRGEPRGPHHMGNSWLGRGDCVDCNACVAACPMGIDIRDGQQLECITCALCIDACDDVMARVGRPRGLIDYDSLANQARRAAGLISRPHLLRLRTALYFALWSAVGCIMLYVLLTRADLDINVLRDRNPLYVQLSDGSIRNGYTFKILNKAHKQRTFSLSAEGIDGLGLRVVGSEDVGQSAAPFFTVKPDRLESFRLLVTAPPRPDGPAAEDIRFVLSDVNSDAVARYDSVFRAAGK